MTHTTKHTPGPWEVKPIGKQLYVEAKDGQGFVCDMQINDALGETDSPHIRADAHLIAAAPAMYEALKEIDDQLDQFTLKAQEELGLREALLKIRAALAQAEGKHD